MAHFITDAEGKLHKIAGNFNPSYKCSQLVVEKTFESGATFDVTGLDLYGDGGYYDIIIMPPTGATTNNSYFTFNGLADSYVYISYTDQGGSHSAGTQKSDTRALLGVCSNYNNISHMMLFSKNGVPMWKIDSWGYTTSIYSQTTMGYGNTRNVTSMQIIFPTTIPSGLKVQVYKRTINETVSNNTTTPTHTLIGHITSPSNGSVVNLNDKISNFDEITTIMINTSDGWYNYNSVPAFEVLNRNVQNSRIVQMIGSGVYVNYYSNGDSQLVLPYVSGTTHFYIYGVKY